MSACGVIACRTLARAQGHPGPIGVQCFYSLVEHGVENAHVPLAQSAGLGLVPWGPLAYGLLTGKYDRATVEAAPRRQGGVPNRRNATATTRPLDDKHLDGDNPFGDTLFTDRNWRILDVFNSVAREPGETPARVALAWVVGRPGVASTLMGVSRAEQVSDNVAALDLHLPVEQRAALDDVSSANQQYETRPCSAVPTFGARPSLPSATAAHAVGANSCQPHGAVDRQDALRGSRRTRVRVLGSGYRRRTRRE